MVGRLRENTPASARWVVSGLGVALLGVLALLVVGTDVPPRGALVEGSLPALLGVALVLWGSRLSTHYTSVERRSLARWMVLGIGTLLGWRIWFRSVQLVTPAERIDPAFAALAAVAVGATGGLLIGRSAVHHERESYTARGLRTAIDTAVDGISLLDADEEYVYVNQAHADVYGYEDAEAFLGNTWRICYDDDQLSFFEEEVKPVLESAGQWRGEATGVRADGTTFPQELTLTVLDDGRTVCVVRDVTERKRREQCIADLHAATRELMEAGSRQEVCAVAARTAESVIQLPITGVWLYEAEADALEPYGATEYARELFGEIPRFSRGSGLIWRAWEDGETYVYDDVHARSDVYNPDTPVRSEMHLPVGESGAIIVAAEHVDAFDETDVHAAQILAANTNAALERAEREQQLQTKQTELRRQNERLEEFAHVISHDLRNPLNVAQGNLELARTECDSGHLDVVGRSHDRMETIIEDVLTLARQGRTVGETTLVELETLATRAWDNVETAEADLAVEAIKDHEADADRLLQAFENLFRNAIEHGDATSVEVGPLADGFYVADDGRGIPDEERERVFESGHSNSADGTGLGLAIVKRIVEAHGWEIEVAAGADGGARFEITTAPDSS